MSELLHFIEERQAAGELMVDDEEKFYDRIRSKDPTEFDELEGFVGKRPLLSLYGHHYC